MPRQKSVLRKQSLHTAG